MSKNRASCLTELILVDTWRRNDAIRGECDAIVSHRQQYGVITISRACLAIAVVLSQRTNCRGRYASQQHVLTLFVSLTINQILKLLFCNPCQTSLCFKERTSTESYWHIDKQSSAIASWWADFLWSHTSMWNLTQGM